MSEKQTINDLLMEVAKLRKDNDYLNGELGYWKQQAGHYDADHNEMDEADSRVKLEADALALVDNLRVYGYKYAGDAEVEIIGMLDRQAAITREEWCNEKGWWDSARACNDVTAACYEKDERIAGLEAELEEVTEQRNAYHYDFSARMSLREQVKKLETENAKLQEQVDVLEAELDAKQGALDIAVKNESSLEQRIIELEKDNDRLMQKVADAKVGAIGCPAYNPETHYCRWHCADFELNRSTLLKLRQDNYALRNERDELREKLSQAMDHAHSFGKLGEI